MAEDNIFDNGDPINATPYEPKSKSGRKSSYQKKQIQVNSTNPTLKIYRMYDDVQLPSKGTEQAACYDVRAYLKLGMIVDVFRTDNTTVGRAVRDIDGNIGIVLDPGERILMPCGLIFDVPVGYSVRSHPRSGLSLKQALTLINGEGVIDSDYIHEGFMPLVNHSNVRQFILHNERCCQIEMVEDLKYSIEEIKSPPKQKTSRSGGFGHSGKQ